MKYNIETIKQIVREKSKNLLLFNLYIYIT